MTVQIERIENGIRFSIQEMHLELRTEVGRYECQGYCSSTTLEGEHVQEYRRTFINEESEMPSYYWKEVLKFVDSFDLKDMTTIQNELAEWLRSEVMYCSCFDNKEDVVSYFER